MRWNERRERPERPAGGGKGATDEARTRALSELQEKHPSLPVVKISGLPFHRTEDELM